MLALSTLYNHNGSNRAIQLLPLKNRRRKKTGWGGGGGGGEEERNCHDKNCAAKCILIIFNSLVIYFCLIVQGLLTVGFLFQRCTCHSLCFCHLHSTLFLLYSLFADTVEMYLPPTCNPKRNCTCKLCNCRRRCSLQLLITRSASLQNKASRWDRVSLNLNKRQP